MDNSACSHTQYTNHISAVPFPVLHHPTCHYCSIARWLVILFSPIEKLASIVYFQILESKLYAIKYASRIQHTKWPILFHCNSLRLWNYIMIVVVHCNVQAIMFNCPKQKYFVDLHIKYVSIQYINYVNLLPLHLKHQELTSHIISKATE